jgi:Brp/Blh family beta-carotene 15,15'-monooxygenase
VTNLMSAYPLRLYSVLFITLPFAFLLNFFHLEMETQLLIASFIISLAGLPHGAADAWLAQRVGIIRNTKDLFTFLVSYTFVAMSIIFAWMISPSISLAIFLIISAWHFGDDERLGLSLFTRFCSGVIIVSSPLLLHNKEVLSLYEILIGNYANNVLDSQIILFITSCGYLIYNTIRSFNDMRTVRNISNIMLYVILSCIITPILYFTIYFCCAHSFQHMSRIWDMTTTKNRSKFLIAVTLLTTLVIVFALVIYFWLIRSGINFEIVNIKVLFVGLAALAVPHILLIDICKAADIQSPR